MTENVFAAALYRLPIVMMAVNRTLGPPWNIWVDHGDTLALRDAGWIQLYCENNQEVFDSILLAYRLAEDRRVLLPVMVCQDAFVLSHTMMQIEVPPLDLVKSFLPTLDLPHRVAQQPVTVGGLDFPHETEVHRRQHAEAMARVPDVYAECQESFAQLFGRRPADAIECHRMEDAEVALVAMSTTASTVRTVVDAARARGVKVGSIRVRMVRPFPDAELRDALGHCRRIGILDRDISLGLGGILWSEARGTAPSWAIVQNYVVGLGGGDIRPEHVEEILADLTARPSASEPKIMEVAT
jgi:pyruvate/2-oxoacid:ferredoxin oxidoreductase alpha subunit